LNIEQGPEGKYAAYLRHNGGHYTSTNAV
jgi:hypothetical protein